VKYTRLDPFDFSAISRIWVGLSRNPGVLETLSFATRQWFFYRYHAEMKAWLQNLSTLEWWLGVVVVGIAINLVSAYLKRPFDKVFNRIAR